MSLTFSRWLRNLSSLTASAALVTGLAGCTGGDDDDDDATEEDPVAEACEHMAEGPSSAVTATAEGAGAPDVSTSHTRYDISLIDVEGGKGGTVSYASGAEGDYALFLNKDVALTVTDADGAAVNLESKEAISACEAVVVRYNVELGVGTYRFTLGPTTETTVSAVIEADAGPDHE